MSVVITLTTDFGLNDGYVASIKGAILSVNPQATLVDVAHTVEPQNVAQAAYLVGAVHRHFPRGSIHFVVVDPGVGTQRQAAILATPEAAFVAPDNGCLSQVLEDTGAGPNDGDGRRAPGTGSAAFAITSERFFRHPVSATFLGRDIFAPVAAHLSLGRRPDEFGEPLATLQALPPDHPHRTDDGHLIGRIVHVDTFGNLISNITTDDLAGAFGAGSESMSFEIAGHTIRGLCRTYSDASGTLALIDSNGHLEIAANNGSARDLLSAGVDSAVTVVGAVSIGATVSDRKMEGGRQ